MALKSLDNSRRHQASRHQDLIPILPVFRMVELHLDLHLDLC